MIEFIIGIVVALVTILYVGFGLRTYYKFVWCFGTSHNGHKDIKAKLYDLGVTFLLVMLWPLFYLWRFLLIYSAILFPEIRVDKLYVCDGKPGPQYRCLGKSIGAGTSKGSSLVAYQDIKTKQLYHRIPDDFHQRMKLK